MEVIALRFQVSERGSDKDAERLGERKIIP